MGDRNEQENTLSPSTGVTLQRSRRRLLAAAAGGFALAASGLFLPDWWEEAEARPGANSGKLGGRHGRNRRGRHKHENRDHGQNHDKRPDQDSPRGGGIRCNRMFGFIVRNARSVPVQVQGWDVTPQGNAWYVPNGWDWETLPAKPVDGAPPTREFIGNTHYTIVRIGADHLVTASIFQCFYQRPDLGADADLRTGGWSSSGWNPKGVTRAGAANIPIGYSFSKDGITVTRLADDDTHKRFSIDLL